MPDLIFTSSFNLQHRNKSLLGHHKGGKSQWRQSQKCPLNYNKEKRMKEIPGINRVPLNGCFWDLFTVQPSCFEREKKREGEGRHCQNCLKDNLFSWARLNQAHKVCVSASPQWSTKNQPCHLRTKRMLSLLELKATGRIRQMYINSSGGPWNNIASVHLHICVLVCRCLHCNPCLMMMIWV